MVSTTKVNSLTSLAIWLTGGQMRQSKGLLKVPNASLISMDLLSIQEQRKMYLFVWWSIANMWANFIFQLNGINTVGENVADNGGVRESYLAFRAYAEKSSNIPLVPYLSKEFSVEQIFFLSYANVSVSPSVSFYSILIMLIFNRSGVVQHAQNLCKQWLIMILMHLSSTVSTCRLATLISLAKLSNAHLDLQWTPKANALSGNGAFALPAEGWW